MGEVKYFVLAFVAALAPPPFAACQEYAQRMIAEKDIVEHAMRQARRALWTKVLVAVATADLLVYVALR